MSDEQERIFTTRVENKAGEEIVEIVSAKKLGSFILDVANSTGIKQVGWREKYFEATAITVDFSPDEQLE